MKQMNEIRQATLALRDRTGCKEYGVRVSDGRAQIVKVSRVPRMRKSNVAPMSNWYPVADIVRVINQFLGEMSTK